MKKLGHTFYWGVSLLVSGIILMVANLGQFDQWAEYIMLGVIALSALSGIVFLIGYVSNRERWWLWLPATTLLSLAAVVYLGHKGTFPLTWLLSLLAFGVAVGFFVVYLLDSKHWWAVIPGGLLLALALLIGFATKFSPHDLAGFFFIALGAVAALIYLVRFGEKEAWPAALFTVIFLTLGFLLLSLEGWERGTLTKFWPALLVLSGLVVVIWRTAWALAPTREERPEAWQPPESWTAQPTPAGGEELAPPLPAEEEQAPAGGEELAPPLPAEEEQAPAEMEPKPASSENQGEVAPSEEAGTPDDDRAEQARQ